MRKFHAEEQRTFWRKGMTNVYQDDHVFVSPDLATRVVACDVVDRLSSATTARSVSTWSRRPCEPGDGSRRESGRRVSASSAYDRLADLAHCRDVGLSSGGTCMKGRDRFTAKQTGDNSEGLVLLGGLRRRTSSAMDCDERGPPRWQARRVIEERARGGPFVCCTLDWI
jgi:hypothetical protein